MRRHRLAPAFATALLLLAESAAAQGAAQCAARSSDWLRLLPEGVEKRRFILDCTGCHQFDSQRALTGGAPRTEAQWIDAVNRMLGYAGATTGFPVIASGQSATGTAAWLTSSLRGKTATAAACTREMPRGASVEEFMMPQAGDLPHDIAVDPYGLAIITGMFSHQMYALDPRTRVLTPVSIPVPNANPRAVEIDSAGSWWVALGNPQAIARYRPERDAWSTWPIGMYPHSIAVGGAGRVWFNGHFTRNPELIGYVDAAGTAVERVTVPSHPTMATDPAGPIPYEIRAAPDGKVWGSELQGNRVFSYDPASRKFTTYDMPLPHSGPRRLDIDASGIVWIPAYSANALVRLDPATGTFQSLPLPIPDAVPYVVRVDRSSGIVWIGTGAADAVLSYDPRAASAGSGQGGGFTVYPLPSNGALVRHLAIDPRNHEVWIAYGGSPGIGARVARLKRGD